MSRVERKMLRVQDLFSPTFRDPMHLMAETVAGGAGGGKWDRDVRVPDDNLPLREDPARCVGESARGARAHFHSLPSTPRHVRARAGGSMWRASGSTPSSRLMRCARATFDR
jgi:hypothetical protein